MYIMHTKCRMLRYNRRPCPKLLVNVVPAIQSIDKTSVHKEHWVSLVNHESCALTDVSL